ncbi:hypothetical protein I6F33_21790 [Bradyrhizobium sp. BRP20]|uniref:hypothetical protein n=1 Tax=Bradyrhizobium sp. BRP20 TaxID=2793822 RepID=UPI001CD8066A|nr:hypothetical protein [Bradyrhizobium sp. BRP20]MCA1435599.1 hypothetical protein [Bradyrhizobium sp. BRP20]
MGEINTERPTFRGIAVIGVIAVVCAAPPPMLGFLVPMLDTTSDQHSEHYQRLGAACTIAPVLGAIFYIYHYRDFLSSSRGSLYLTAMSALALDNLSYTPESISFFFVVLTYGFKQAGRILVGLPAIFIWYIVLKLIFRAKLASILETITRIPRTRFLAFFILVAVPPLVDFYLASIPPLYTFSPAEFPVSARPTSLTLGNVIRLDAGKLLQHSLQLVTLFGILWACGWRFPRATTTPLMVVLFFVLLLHSSLGLISTMTIAMSNWLFHGLPLPWVSLGVQPILDRSTSVLISFCLMLAIFGRRFSQLGSAAASE